MSKVAPIRERFESEFVSSDERDVHSIIRPSQKTQDILKSQNKKILPWLETLNLISIKYQKLKELQSKGTSSFWDFEDKKSSLVSVEKTLNSLELIGYNSEGQLDKDNSILNKLEETITKLLNDYEDFSHAQSYCCIIG